MSLNSQQDGSLRRSLVDIGKTNADEIVLALENAKLCTCNIVEYGGFAGRWHLGRGRHPQCPLRRHHRQHAEPCPWACICHGLQPLHRSLSPP